MFAKASQEKTNLQNSHERPLLFVVVQFDKKESLE